MQTLRDEIAAAIYKPSHCMTLDDCRIQADAAIAVFKAHQSHRLKEAERLLRWADEAMSGNGLSKDDWYGDYELWQRDLEQERKECWRETPGHHPRHAQWGTGGNSDRGERIMINMNRVVQCAFFLTVGSAIGTGGDIGSSTFLIMSLSYWIMVICLWAYPDNWRK